MLENRIYETFTKFVRMGLGWCEVSFQDSSVFTPKGRISIDAWVVHFNHPEKLQLWMTKGKRSCALPPSAPSENSVPLTNIVPFFRGLASDTVIGRRICTAWGKTAFTRSATERNNDAKNGYLPGIVRTFRTTKRIKGFKSHTQTHTIKPEH